MDTGLFIMYGFLFAFGSRNTDLVPKLMIAKTEKAII